ncbi:hypothetical protein LCGC14_2613920 [marine sediment metagenome]|uniref:Uncharacterized protein n=1 Tax=marine sediment metagenome TaxID=412755 RepID=A0A0F9CG66_9ZZZZ
MREYPIIFSGDHPRKTLDLGKTQTRRVIKPQPKLRHLGYMMNYEGTGAIQCGADYPDTDKDFIKCPYGQVGDRLGVKETHYRFGDWNKNGLTKTGRQKWRFQAVNNEVRYFDNPPDKVRPNSFRALGWYKRPSIFLPKRYIRIWLEITEVRVERLRSISPTDALAEGGYTVDGFIKMYLIINHLPEDANPWNWALRYKLLGVGNKF